MSQPAYLTVADITSRLPLSKDAIYRAIRREELPAFKRCGRVLVAENDLYEWIEAGRVRASRRELPTPIIPVTRGPRGNLRPLHKMPA